LAVREKPYPNRQLPVQQMGPQAAHLDGSNYRDFSGWWGIEGRQEMAGTRLFAISRIASV